MGGTIWQSMQQKGYSRRDFLQFCTAAAAAAGLAQIRRGAGCFGVREEGKAGRGVDALSGVHLLQRVVHPLVAPDRGGRAAGRALAELHRDADGGVAASRRRRA